LLLLFEHFYIYGVITFFIAKSASHRHRRCAIITLESYAGIMRQRQRVNRQMVRGRTGNKRQGPSQQYVTARPGRAVHCLRPSVIARRRRLHYSRLSVITCQRREVLAHTWTSQHTRATATLSAPRCGLLTTASSPTKFCTTQKTAKYSSWVAQIRVLEIQDGGRTQFWKPSNRNTSAMVRPILTNFWTTTHIHLVLY